MSVLAEDQLQQALTSLPQWEREGRAIVRNLQFPDFAQAMKFVNAVAQLAEEADHHPDIDIRYNKVKLALWSHDSGGVTARDIRMARRLAELTASQNL